MGLAMVPFRRRVRFVAPVYLDANFLVASYLRGHVRYQRARYSQSCVTLSQSLIVDDK